MQPLTKETVPQRPAGYVDEEVVIKEDDFNGLPHVELENILSEIDRIMEEEKKTPLLLDKSLERKVATFYSYTGVNVDGTMVNLFLRNRARSKPKDFMETFRSNAVAAMKRGVTLSLDIGECDNSKMPLESTLCKPDSIPKSIFIQGGKQLASNTIYF